MAGPVVPMMFNLTLFSSLSKVSLGQVRTEILRTKLEENGTYDSRIPPNFEDDFPTKVMVQLYVSSIDSVNEASMAEEEIDRKQSHYAVTAGQRHWVGLAKSRPTKSKFDKSKNMDYSMSIYLRQNWTDARLMWDDENAQLGRIEIDTKMMNSIWMPDLYFVNEKEAIMHEVTVANRLLHLYPNGTVQTSMRISMTLGCDMFLWKYPHDTQNCFVSLGSYSYTADNLVFVWHPTPIMMREGMTLPRFDVSFERAGKCEFKFDAKSMISGNFSCITAEFKLTRLFEYYIAQVYLPSVLIVVLSWVSFWIDIDAIPARVSLGLLTVLTMTTQSTGARNSLPRVSYVKAIDVWMATCLGFVFAALLEFAYVNVQNRVEKRRRESVMGEKDPNGHFNEERYRNKEISYGPNRRMVYLKDKLKRQRARMADKISRIAFPVAFFVFNIIYWCYYLIS